MKKDEEKAINDFRVVVDNREQLPFKFSNIMYTTLPYGDYTIEYAGKIYIDKIVIERKGNVSELFAFSGSNRERFCRELEKMKNEKYKYLLFEFDFMDIVNKQPYGKLPASTVFATLFSFMIKYQITPLFCGNRTNARNTLYKLFQFFVKYEILGLHKNDT